MCIRMVVAKDAKPGIDDFEYALQAFAARCVMLGLVPVCLALSFPVLARVGTAYEDVLGERILGKHVAHCRYF